MIHIRDEGGVIDQGLNIYPISNRHCRGFIFRLGSASFGLRWNSVLRRLWMRIGQRHYMLYGPR